MFSLLIVFVLNFLFGLLAGIIIQGEGWNFKKAFTCIVELMVFVTIVASIYVIGYLKHNPNGAVWCVSFVSYSILYYYALNILKNLKRLLPNNSIGHRAVAFLYYVLSAEIIKKIPYLEAYIKMEDKNGK